jgi:hypothetical protein
MANELSLGELEALVELKRAADSTPQWKDGDERCHCTHCATCEGFYATYAWNNFHREVCAQHRRTVQKHEASLLAMAKRLVELESQIRHLRERGFYLDHDDTQMNWKPLQVDVMADQAASTGWTPDAGRGGT